MHGICMNNNLQGGVSQELALRYLQNVALGFEAHRTQLPLFAAAYNDLKAKASEHVCARACACPCACERIFMFVCLFVLLLHSTR